MGTEVFKKVFFFFFVSLFFLNPGSVLGNMGVKTLSRKKAHLGAKLLFPGVLKYFVQARVDFFRD